MTVTISHLPPLSEECYRMAKVQQHEDPDSAKSDMATTSKDIRPCYFPCLDSNLARNGEWQSAEVPYCDFPRLSSFSKECEVSAQAVLQTAWAMVLRVYLGGDSVCFGFNASSPSIVTTGNAVAHEPCFNLTTCHTEFNDTSTAQEQVGKMHANLLAAQIQLPTFIAGVNGHSKPSEARIFNTAILYQERQDGSIRGGSILHNKIMPSLHEVSDSFGPISVHPSFGTPLTQDLITDSTCSLRFLWASMSVPMKSSSVSTTLIRSCQWSRPRMWHIPWAKSLTTLFLDPFGLSANLILSLNEISTGLRDGIRFFPTRSTPVCTILSCSMQRNLLDPQQCVPGMAI